MFSASGAAAFSATFFVLACACAVADAAGDGARAVAVAVAVPGVPDRRVCVGVSPPQAIHHGGQRSCNQRGVQDLEEKHPLLV